MSISARVILDSISPLGPRITTIEYVAPRYILPEFNTHRVFSRNTASSRAIPVRKIINSVKDDPVIPAWTRNQPGMQGKADYDDETQIALTFEWLKARDFAVQQAEELFKLGAHKQNINRLLEPFLYYKAIVTSTDYDHFLSLRDHEAAQPEIRTLAQCIRVALEGSTSRNLHVGEWHIPYLRDHEREELDRDQQLKVSVARCARVSYKTFDDDKFSVIDRDIQLFDQLLAERHFSPFEHQAYVISSQDWQLSRDLMGNLKGFGQHRKLIEHGVLTYK